MRILFKCQSSDTTPIFITGNHPALGEWDMVKSAAFLLVLQLAGINTTGALVFRLFGLGPRGARYQRGQRWLSWSTWGASALVLGALLTWQLGRSPELQRSSRQQRASALVQEVVNQSGQARLVEARVRFTRADIPGQDTLLAVVHVQPEASQRGPAASLERELTEQLKRRMREHFDVTPLVDLTVLDP